MTVVHQVARTKGATLFTLDTTVRILKYLNMPLHRHKPNCRKRRRCQEPLQ